MTFHFIVRKLIILSLHEEKDTYFLLSYNEACELENPTFLCTAPAPEHDLYGNPLYASYIASHPSGLAVVLGNLNTHILHCLIAFAICTYLLCTVLRMEFKYSDLVILTRCCHP